MLGQFRILKITGKVTLSGLRQIESKRQAVGPADPGFYLHRVKGKM